MVSCGSVRPRPGLGRGHLWGELPLSQGTDTSQPCCSLCGVETEKQRGRRGEGWEAALRVEGTGQCLGHRHTQSVIRKVLLPGRRLSSEAGRQQKGEQSMELGSRAEAVLHRRRTEEAVETMKPLPCLLPFLPANSTLMAGTSVHSVLMKASGWEIPQKAETTPFSRACDDKGVQQEPPTHPCMILKPIPVSPNPVLSENHP